MNLLIGFLLCGAAAAAEIPPASWMGRLDGSRTLSQLTIPGTHNSAARHEPVAGTAKCQDATITAQLEMGVRFLDLRCRHSNNRFKLFHGPIDQRQGFEEATAEIKAFLVKHPLECVLVSIKEEHSASGSTRTFGQTFEDYAGKEASAWMLGGRMPELGAARGKMILIRRFPADAPMGIDASRWPDNTAFETPGLAVQDCYQVADVEVKWQRVEDGLRAAARMAGNGRLSLNFASGYRSGALGLPDIRAVAGVVNPRLDVWLASVTAGSYGCVIMDFASARTCEALIRTNFPDPQAKPPHERIRTSATERKEP